MSRTRIGVRQLRQELAIHLRGAGSGQRIVITAGGRPTAMLGPLEDGADDVSIDAHVTTGALVPPRRNDAPRISAPIAVWSGVRLDQAFREVRG